MASGFHDGSRSLQDRFDTRALADRIDDLLVSDTISDGDRAFIEARDMFFLATADAEGRPTCSYKGGEPGFVRVLDEHTLAFPNYDGNGMYLSTGNVLVNPHVGMLFIDFEKGHRMRLEGEASIDLDDPLRAEWPEAQFVVRVRARAVYPNCPRYIHRYELVQRLAVRAAGRLPDAGAGVEALRLGDRRAAGRRPGSRPGRARRAGALSPGGRWAHGCGGLEAQAARRPSHLDLRRRVRGSPRLRPPDGLHTSTSDETRTKPGHRRLVPCS